MGFKPSKFQKAIFKFVAEENGSAVIEAVAGSGKTKTLVEILKKIPPHLRSVFLAFNKSISEEIKRRVPPNIKVQTLNGLGHGAWMRFIDGNVRLNSNKTRDILFNNAHLKETYNEFTIRKLQTPVRRLVSIAKSIGLVPENNTEAVGLVSDNLETWERIIDHFDIQFGMTAVGGDMISDKPTAIAMAKEVLTIGLDMWNEIDFDDQMYMTVVFNTPMSKYDLVFVDEAQDVSDIQRAMLTMCRRKTGRLIAVGDPCQCQTGGTVISLTGGKAKKLRDIKVGDEVVSYDRHASSFVGRKTQGRKVLEKSSRKYNGNLFTIYAGNNKTRATFDHRWLVRFSPMAVSTKWNCVYLMENYSGDFRIGWCQLFYKNGGFHLAQRCRAEKAKSAWILGVFDSKSDASAMESIIAAKFGLPTITFQPVNGANLITKDFISKVFLELGCLKKNVIKCLESFNRSINYPFYSKDVQKRQGTKSLFVTQSCNLIPEIMCVPLFADTKDTTWKPIVNVELRKVKNLTVYSLKAETHELYVANGILTHNSIYGFRGADSESLANIAKTFNARRLPLSISYRCPKQVVLEAQKYVSHIESHESAPEGEVEDFGIYSPQMFRPNDMVVCRNTAPLIKLAYKLISAKIPATIMGRDIGKGLVTLINKLKPKGVDNLFTKLNEWRAKETQRVLGKDPEADLSKIEDKYEIIVMFIQCSGADTIDSLIAAIESLFGDKAVDAVVLSTVHRAKGMEADRVFILDSWLMPSKYARKPWQQVQERNLFYVAITRAKKSLFYVTSPKGQR